MVYTTALFSDAHVDTRSQSDDCCDAEGVKCTGIPPEGGTGYGWLDIVEKNYASNNEQDYKEQGEK
jgi:hypothetical protein